jgi:hypothetical protein
MKCASKFDQFWHELVAFTKEYWFEVAVFCVGIAVVFWVMTAVFNL